MSIFDLIFPTRCLGCEKNSAYFCQKCIKTIKPVFPQLCPICERASIGGTTHKRCTKGYAPDGLTSIWLYDGVVRKAIKKLKYKFLYEIAQEMGLLAASDLKKTIDGHLTPLTKDKVLLVPIPLHWRRQNWRGFNHSEEIGKILTKGLGWNVSNLLIRTKSTQPQVELGEEARSKNITGAFMLNPKVVADKFTQIVLFDDVWTTGSTMLEAVKELKKAGFKKIWCLTVAR